WSSVARPRIAGKRLGARGVRWMTTRTQASRSAGRAPRTTWIARMPPAEPTTATTWVARGSAVRDIRPGEEAADRFRLLARLPGDGLETGAALGRACLPELFREAFGDLRALLKGTERRPQSVLDRFPLGVESGLSRVGVADPAAEARQLRVVELPEHSTAVGTGVDRRAARRALLDRVRIEG